MLKSIIHNGLTKEDDAIQVFRTILVNLVVVLTIPFLLINVVLSLSANIYISASITSIGAVLLTLVYFLNKRRKFRLARIIVLFTLITMISFVLLIYGRDSDVQVLLLSMMIFVFILFDSKRIWLFMGSYVVLSFFIPYLFLEYYEPLDYDESLPYLHFFVMSFAVLTISVLSYVVMNAIKLYLYEKAKALETISDKNKALIAQNELIQSQKEELELFTTIAAHDLKTPLRTINGFLGLLKKTEISDSTEASNYLEHALSGTEQLNSLINGISTLRQLDQEEPENYYAPTKVILEKIAAQLNPKKLESINLVFDKLIDLKIEESHLYHLFYNLIENGIIYNDQKIKSVVISSQLNKGTISYTVKDNGFGIDDNYLEYIFEPFKKLHSSEVYKSSGLGLSICKKITTLYSGDIKVQSSSAGSTFIIEFPSALAQ